MNMNYFVKTIICYAHFTLFYDRVIVILHDRPCRTWCLQGMPTFIKNLFKVCQLVKFNRCLYSERLCLFSN